MLKTVILAEFKHETNRYSPGVTDASAFAARISFYSEQQIRQGYQGARNEMTGFLDVLDPQEQLRLVPVLALNASPGPVVSSEVWEDVCRRLLQAIEEQPQVHGILLALHGAMVTEKTEDGEGDLLLRLREKVGPQVPILATLDLHANVTRKMIDHADGFFPYDYYPHTDLYEAGQRAAQCMLDTLDGAVKPVLAWHKLDLLLPYMPTEHPAMAPFVERTRSLRGKGSIINANLCHGFFAADIYEQGAAVLVTANGDKQMAQDLADSLGRDIFDSRSAFKREFYTPEEALDVALGSLKQPVTIADVADNPGSGATCDTVTLLKAMLDRQVTDAALAVIYDPQTVLDAEQAGVGNCFKATLGGKLAPEVTGGPLRCTARVCCINDGVTRNREGCSVGVMTYYGKTAVLQIEGIKVIVCSSRTQPWGLEIYRYCGIQPQDMKLLVVKSAVQFRASFETVSDLILDVETAGLGPQNPTMLPLTHCRRPIYPLDPI